MDSGLLQILESIDAVKHGHFVLSSGKHSDIYIQMALALQHYDITVDIAEDLVALFSDQMVDVVIGPAVGAVILSYEVARLMEARSIYTEKDENGKMILKRGFELNPGDHVLIVEDVYATGKSVNEIAEIVKHNGATLCGVAAVVNLSKQKSPKVKSKKLNSLIRIKSNFYDKEKCPMCANKEPIDK